MSYSKTIAAVAIGFTIACSGGSDAESGSEETDVPDMRTASAAALPDPCGLVTDDEFSEYLWQDMEANQRESLRARNAQHIITKRVENVDNPAGRTCFFQYRRVAGDTVWGEGDFQLRTLARQTFQMFADNSPSSQRPIPDVGDQAFYLSNSAYARRGDVGVEFPSFDWKENEIELLKKIVARLP
jgi:hypothetical protein